MSGTNEAMDGSVSDAVWWAVNRAVIDAVSGAMWGAVGRVVDNALHWNVRDAVYEAAKEDPQHSDLLDLLRSVEA